MWENLPQRPLPEALGPFCLSSLQARDRSRRALFAGHRAPSMSPTAAGCHCRSIGTSAWDRSPAPVVVAV